MSASLTDLGKSFARHLRAEGRAPRTVALYGMSVTMYADWLASRGVAPTLEAFTRDNIREWLAHLGDTRAPGTVRTRYRGLHRFAGWLVDEEEITDHPMRALSPPEAKANPVPVLSDEELAALLKACRGRTFNDRRDEAVIRVLLDTGIRVSELCGLTTETVDLDNGMALVTGKGSKVRPVYLSTRTIAALDRYARARTSHRHAYLPAYFLTQRGALSTDGAREIIRNRGKAAGIDGLHPHRFRHTFAHDFLMAGGQERDLKRLAGWTSDVMLERYGASAADARARQAAQRLRRGDRV